MPRLAVIYIVVTLAAVGMPLLSGFIGQFTVLRGAFEVRWTWAAWAALGAIIGAASLLWLYQRVMFGSTADDTGENPADLTRREFATLIPLVLISFWIGVYPAPMFRVLKQPVERIIEAVHPSRYLAPQTAEHNQFQPTPAPAPATSIPPREAK